jgi:hypothetical protein
MNGFLHKMPRTAQTCGLPGDAQVPVVAGIC